jgi:hypothetical protein
MMKLKEASKRSKDVKGVVSRQKRYSTLAKKEGNYALKKAAEEKKKHLPEMEKDSEREAKIAFSFANKRNKIAKNEAKKLRGKQ